MHGLNPLSILFPLDGGLLIDATLQSSASLRSTSVPLVSMGYRNRCVEWLITLAAPRLGTLYVRPENGRSLMDDCGRPEHPNHDAAERRGWSATGVSPWIRAVQTPKPQRGGRRAPASASSIAIREQPVIGTAASYEGTTWTDVSEVPRWWNLHTASDIIPAGGGFPPGDGSVRVPC